MIVRDFIDSISSESVAKDKGHTDILIGSNILENSSENYSEPPYSPQVSLGLGGGISSFTGQLNLHLRKKDDYFVPEFSVYYSTSQNGLKSSKKYGGGHVGMIYELRNSTIITPFLGPFVGYARWWNKYYENNYLAKNKYKHHFYKLLNKFYT